jgi:hypothetical protein
VIAALFLIVQIVGKSSGAPHWLRQLDFGMAPLGLVLWGIAWTYVERARARRPNETFAPRTLRWTALGFFVLGALLVGIGVYEHFGRNAQ